jgi:spermidine/putrescine transport system substrate-binding protein
MHLNFENIRARVWHLWVRFVIVAGYLACGMLILYMPKLVESWSSDNALNICIFAETFTPEAIEKFEKTFGVTVNVTYVEIDDQTYAKFRMNGADGYDVANISDFTIDLLKQQDLLLPLDYSLLPNVSRINPHLLDKNYDQKNEVCLPHKWYLFGVAYDTQFFKKSQDEMSLKYIFQDPVELARTGQVPRPYKVVVLDEIRDIFHMASICLNRHAFNLTSPQLQQLGDVLYKQKDWVEAYTVHSAQYFLFSEIVPIALMSSNYMRKMLEVTDRFKFAIPREGGVLVLENLAIPRKTKRAQLAHKFINFMLSDEIAQLNSSTYGFNSANLRANDGIEKEVLNDRHLFPDDAMFKQLHIPLLPPHQLKEVEDLWLKVCFK